MFLSLSACNTPVSKSVPSSSVASSHTQETAKAQDLSNITSLAVPNKVVYVHNGIRTTYTNENPKFQNIIEMNAVRQTSTLEALKLAIDSATVAKQGDYLIYEYENNRYESVYFHLMSSPDNNFANWVANVDGKNVTPYGNLAPVDELLTYLKR
ncbi:hypothetical protein MUG87_02300 [Ectobacillus sp. JY-23]|uniref:hypothetical protein n=1 Tax=Ectobacillus sp. JY-23 TaxID=2933872 RepID=UPI001FF299A6|nr:hypothetical protein [Ectobacillus sp. JY-23]UOY92990.1 hypothetical protein MUG87_02300 [Ectobacillus sp. JY-23]